MADNEELKPTPAAHEPEVGEPLLAELNNLCTGLLFPSESDRPVEPFFWKRADLEAGGESIASDNEPITALTLLAAGKAPENALIEQQSTKKIFAPVTEEQTWWGEPERERATKLRALQTALEERLRGLTVFRVGASDIDVYVVGRAPGGDVAGVHTSLVET